MGDTAEEGERRGGNGDDEERRTEVGGVRVQAEERWRKGRRWGGEVVEVFIEESRRRWKLCKHVFHFRCLG